MLNTTPASLVNQHAWQLPIAAVDALVAVSSEPVASRVLDRLVDDVREALRARPSFIRLATVAPLDECRGERLLLALSQRLGELLPQDAEGTLVRRVRDRGTRIGEGRTARYSDSRFGGSLHTDGAERPQPVPELFALLCVRQAVTGGSLVLVHVDDIVESLPAEALRVLQQPFHFDRRGDQGPGEAPTTSKPVLARTNGRWTISYLREYVEAGHRHDGVPPLVSTQRKALDLLDARTMEPDLQTVIRMEPGELAVFDNRTVLHGRTTFEDTGSPDEARLLLRTWIRA